MASEIRTTETTEMGRPVETGTRMALWVRGMVAGLAGGLVFGILMSLMMPAALEESIPALWGLSGGLAGWFVHMSNSAIFGVLFVAIVSRTTLGKYTDSMGESIGLGLAYGLVLWIVAAAIVMPLWLDAVGFAGAPGLPNFDVTSLVGHLAFGLVLGAVYPYLK